MREAFGQFLEVATGRLAAIHVHYCGCFRTVTGRGLQCSGCSLSCLGRDRPITAAKRPSEELDTCKIFSCMKEEWQADSALN